MVERGGRARSFDFNNTNIHAALVTNAHRTWHLRTGDARFYNSIGRDCATTAHAWELRRLGVPVQRMPR